MSQDCIFHGFDTISVSHTADAVMAGKYGSKRGHPVLGMCVLMIDIKGFKMIKPNKRQILFSRAEYIIKSIFHCEPTTYYGIGIVDN